MSETTSKPMPTSLKVFSIFDCIIGLGFIFLIFITILDDVGVYSKIFAGVELIIGIPPMIFAIFFFINWQARFKLVYIMSLVNIFLLLALIIADIIYLFIVSDMSGGPGIFFFAVLLAIFLILFVILLIYRVIHYLFLRSAKKRLNFD